MSQQINLYEDRLRPRLELATGRNLGVAALVVLAGMAGWSFWEGTEADRRAQAATESLQEMVAAQEKVKALSQTVAQRKVAPELAAELDHAKAMIAARDEVIKALDSGALGRTTGFASYMLGFARQAQSDLWLTGFCIAGGGDEIEIHGRMLNPSRLPDYVQRLNAVPIFQGRRFAALEIRRVNAEDRQADSPPVAEAVAGQPGSRAGQTQRQAPFVEFLLRSEPAGSGDAQLRTKDAS